MTKDKNVLYLHPPGVDLLSKSGTKRTNLKVTHIACQNAGEDVKKIEALNNVAFDCAVVDVPFEDTSRRYECVRKVRKQYPNIPIIITTTDPEIEDKLPAELKPLNITSVFIMPQRPTALIQTIQNVLSPERER